MGRRRWGRGGHVAVVVEAFRDVGVPDRRRAAWQWAGRYATRAWKREVVMQLIKAGGDEAPRLDDRGATTLQNSPRWRRRNDSHLPSAVQPPSTTRVCPLMKALSRASAKNAIARAISSGAANLPMGTRRVISASV